MDLAHWVFYDDTFWGTGKTGLILSANENSVLLITTLGGIANHFYFYQNEHYEDQQMITSLESYGDKLKIEYTYNDEQNYSLILVPEKFKNALIEFYVNEIEPRQDI
jgi:hypothetical protein